VIHPSIANDGVTEQVIKCKRKCKVHNTHERRTVHNITYTTTPRPGVSNSNCSEGKVKTN